MAFGAFNAANQNIDNHEQEYYHDPAFEVIFVPKVTLSQLTMFSDMERR